MFARFEPGPTACLANVKVTRQGESGSTARPRRPLRRAILLGLSLPSSVRRFAYILHICVGTHFLAHGPHKRFKIAFTTCSDLGGFTRASSGFQVWSQGDATALTRARMCRPPQRTRGGWWETKSKKLPVDHGRRYPNDGVRTRPNVGGRCSGSRRCSNGAGKRERFARLSSLEKQGFNR